MVIAVEDNKATKKRLLSDQSHRDISSSLHILFNAKNSTYLITLSLNKVKEPLNRLCTFFLAPIRQERFTCFNVTKNHSNIQGIGSSSTIPSSSKSVIPRYSSLEPLRITPCWRCLVTIHFTRTRMAILCVHYIPNFLYSIMLIYRFLT